MTDFTLAVDAIYAQELKDRAAHDALKVTNDAYCKSHNFYHRPTTKSMDALVANVYHYQDLYAVADKLKAGTPLTAEESSLKAELLQWQEKAEQAAADRRAEEEAARLTPAQKAAEAAAAEAKRKAELEAQEKARLEAERIVAEAKRKAELEAQEKARLEAERVAAEERRKVNAPKPVKVAQSGPLSTEDISALFKKGVDFNVAQLKPGAKPYAPLTFKEVGNSPWIGFGSLSHHDITLTGFGTQDTLTLELKDSRARIGFGDFMNGRQERALTVTGGPVLLSMTAGERSAVTFIREENGSHTIKMHNGKTLRITGDLQLEDPALVNQAVAKAKEEAFIKSLASYSHFEVTDDVKRKIKTLSAKYNPDAAPKVPANSGNIPINDLHQLVQESDGQLQLKEISRGKHELTLKVGDEVFYVDAFTQNHKKKILHLRSKNAPETVYGVAVDELPKAAEKIALIRASNESERTDPANVKRFDLRKGVPIGYLNFNGHADEKDFETFKPALEASQIVPSLMRAAGYNTVGIDTKNSLITLVNNPKVPHLKPAEVVDAYVQGLYQGGVRDFYLNFPAHGNKDRMCLTGPGGAKGYIQPEEMEAILKKYGDCSIVINCWGCGGSGLTKMMRNFKDDPIDLERQVAVFVHTKEEELNNSMYDYELTYALAAMAAGKPDAPKTYGQVHQHCDKSQRLDNANSLANDAECFIKVPGKPIQSTTLNDSLAAPPALGNALKQYETGYVPRDINCSLPPAKNPLDTNKQLSC